MKLSLTPVALVITLALGACSNREEPARPAPNVVVPTPVAASPAAPQPVSPAPTAATETEAKTQGTPVKAAPGKATEAPGASGLEVKRLVLASRVVEREPELALEPKVNEPLLAFVEAKNGATEDESIIVTFEHESGTKVGFVELEVPAGAKRWRTWARTQNVKEAGNWVAVVRTAGGEELGRTSFTVSEG